LCCVLFVSFSIGLAVLSVFSSAYIEELYTIDPVLLMSNYKFKDKNQSSNKNIDAEHSPFFQSLQIRYNQIFPQPQDIAAIEELKNLKNGEKALIQISDEHLTNSSSQELLDETWKFVQKTIKNDSYNLIFEMEGNEDFLYLLNNNNDFGTNQTFYPYFGEVNLMRVNMKQYLYKAKDSTSPFKRDIKMKEVLSTSESQFSSG